MQNRVYLNLDTPDSAIAAAQFVAELQRQGVAYEAKQDLVTGYSGTSSAIGMVVTITGH